MATTLCKSYDCQSTRIKVDWSHFYHNTSSILAESARNPLTSTQYAHFRQLPCTCNRRDEEFLKRSNRDHIAIPGGLAIFQLCLAYIYYLELNLNNNVCEE